MYSRNGKSQVPSQIYTNVPSPTSAFTICV
jgi:hypothetical protein